jgi:RNA polymerase sigma factor (sigma-70 family)
MTERDLITEQFEARRGHLRAVAIRMLGSNAEAEDAVQETWLRLNRTDVSEVENLTGWLTTVVARICLDMLRSRKSQREEPEPSDEQLLSEADDPAHEAVLAESVGLAMMAVLQHLSPAERVALVLHDVFGVSFDEVAGVVGRSSVATRKLASRARHRVHTALDGDGDQAADIASLGRIIEAFFKASRDGDFQALLTLLDPDVALRPDETALQMGVRTGWLTSDLRGEETVARQFDGRAQAAQLALLDGVPGAVWAPGGAPSVAFEFTVHNGKVTEIKLTANPERLGMLEIAILPWCSFVPVHSGQCPR